MYSCQLNNMIELGLMKFFQTKRIRGLVNGNGDSPDLELKLAVSLEFRQHLLATVWLEARWRIEQ